MASPKQKEEFHYLYENVVNDVLEIYADAPMVHRHVKTLMENLSKDKQTSGLLTIISYKGFESPDKLTAENIKFANILGWCVDMMMCAQLVIDDMIDSSETRNGLPCWYRNHGIGMTAINDAVLLENAAYHVLTKHLSNHPSYISFCNLLRETMLHVCLSQILGNMYVVNGKPQLDTFTMDKFRMVTKCKTSYPFFVLPIIFAIYHCQKNNTDLHKYANHLCFQLGEYFQVQNDILDCYGDSALTGKTSRDDIVQGKCSWLIATALKQATAEQKKILQINYGRPESECELEVMRLYQDLRILDLFLEYEEKSFKRLCQDVDDMSSDLPRAFFMNLVESVYGQTLGNDILNMGNSKYLEL